MPATALELTVLSNAKLFCYQEDLKRGAGGGGGQVDDMLAFISDNPNSNPGEVCSFIL